MTKTTKRLQHQLRKRKRKRRRRRKKMLCRRTGYEVNSTQLTIVRCSLDISFKSIELLNFLLVCSSNDDFNRSFDVNSFQFSFCFYVNRFERKRKRFFSQNRLFPRRSSRSFSDWSNLTTNRIDAYVQILVWLLFRLNFDIIVSKIAQLCLFNRKCFGALFVREKNESN